MWILLVFEVDQFLAAVTGAPFNRLPTLLAPVLLGFTLFRYKRNTVSWPIVLFLLMHLSASIFAENAGLSRNGFKYMFYVTLLGVSTATLINVPAKLDYILKVYLLSFAWFGLFGDFSGGKVWWHQLLGNEDSFGPLMVMAMPIGFFFAQSTRVPLWRRIGRLVFGLGILGLVVSFARGAAVAGAAVLLYILVFSPNKTRTFVSLMVAAIILIPLVAYFVPLDAYLKEVGTSSGGDPVRAHLWGLAVRVWKTSPWVGVGVNNFGVIGELIATPEDDAMVWGSIYFRAVHSTGFQILAEEGLVGIGLWLTMIVGFFWRTRQLCRKEAVTAWRALGGAEFELVHLTRGLEGAMLGFLLTSIFYNQLYIHWFWSLLTLAFVLHRMTVVSFRRSMPPPGRGGIPARISSRPA